MILTEREYALCEGCDETLRRAQHGNMLTLGRKRVEELMAIFARVTGQPAPRADRCGSCELRVQKAVGQWYLADKAEKEGAAPPEGLNPGTPRWKAQRAEKTAENAKR